MAFEIDPRLKRLEWVNLETLAELFGLSIFEAGPKLTEFRLRGPDGRPTPEAVDSEFAQIHKHWFGPDTFVWNLPKIYPFFEKDPQTQLLMESLVNKGLSTVTQAFLLSESGFQEEAKEYERRFWKSIPRGLYESIYQHVVSLFKKHLPQLTEQLLFEALVESEKSAELLEFTPFRKEGIEPFLKEVESKVKGKTLLTISLGGRSGFNIELLPNNEIITYGRGPEEYHKVVYFISYGVLALTHGELTEVDPTTGAPIKEVRGYRLGTNSRGFFWKSLAVPELRSVYETNPMGKKIASSSDIRFC